MKSSLKFARIIAARLRAASIRPVVGRWFVVTGRLDIGDAYVEVEVVVPWLFRDLRRKPPKVTCLEPWMRKEADWHNGGSLCWVIPLKWRDAMSWHAKPHRRIRREGADWLMADVTALIAKHYLAYKDGSEKWPDHWPSWGHGSRGVREYLIDKHAAIRASREKHAKAIEAARLKRQNAPESGVQVPFKT